MYLKFIKNIYHGRSEIKKATIFSIDIQPFGELILTCGQDWLIKIWNYGQKKLTEKTKGYRKFSKQFKCSERIFNQDELIEIHRGPVNIVRWAGDGKKFASGGDDGNIIIFEESQDPFKKRNWRPFLIFKSHLGDIVDLSWSSDCSFLASASLDRNVFVYNITQKNVLMKLSNQSFGVKGLAWNPHENFLTVQSDDGKVFLWNSFDWESQKIQDLRNDTKSLKTKKKIQLFKRLAWTVCGRFLLLPNNFWSKKKNAVLVFDLVQRFSKKISFIKNSSSVNSIRCSPRLYQKKNSGFIYSLSVFGSILGEIDFWKSGYPRIFFSIKNLIKKQIMDISWSLNGYELIFCSIIGDLFWIKFNSNELGRIILKKRHFCFLKTIRQQFFDKNFIKSISTPKIFFKLKKNLKSFSLQALEKKIIFTESWKKFGRQKTNFSKFFGLFKRKKPLNLKTILKSNNNSRGFNIQTKVFGLKKKKGKVLVFLLEGNLIRMLETNGEDKKKLIGFFGNYLPIFVWNQKKKKNSSFSQKAKVFF
mmetsp:Transcript_14066/g.27975  ORF Transcript_14066/g.27975 Transcript_14066/m.27975 type:complete len:531 (+) Transcript_14066:53-1645(+)